MMEEELKEELKEVLKQIANIYTVLDKAADSLITLQKVTIEQDATIEELKSRIERLENEGK